MSAEEFWFGDPQQYFVYQRAFARKQKRIHDEIDIIGWSFARYNMWGWSQTYANAWGDKSHKDIFPREPLTVKEITTKKAKPKNAEEAFERFKIIAERYNR